VAGEEGKTDWDVIWPYGYPASVESAGSVAAPLLAGFSFALIGLIVPGGKGIRWPGAALALFVAAGLLFIAAVQCGFWARQWTVTPSELNDWRPDEPDSRKHAEQRLHAKGFALWARRLSWAYRWGILSLLAGVTVLLVPPGDPSAWRWVAIVAAVVGWLLEAMWIASGWVLKTSPISLYDDQPDVPRDATSALWFRRIAAIRWLARKFRPVIRASSGRQDSDLP
jgi:hypothetical protein